MTKTEKRWGIMDSRGKVTVLSWESDSEEAAQVARNWDDGCSADGPHTPIEVTITFEAP